MVEKKVTIIQPERERDDILRVAGYARVSSDSIEQLHSFRSQIEFYNNKISNMKKAQLVEVYTDEGITGTRMDKRDGFNQMIRDCENGKIDRILTKSVNRFARNIIETLRVLRELKALGVSVYFEQENIDTAKGGSEVVLSIYCLLSEQESKVMAENQRWAFRTRAKNGIFNQPKLPYGYKRNVNKEIVVDDNQAEIIKLIFDMYVKQDLSTIKILDYLNHNNIGNRRWSQNGLSLILRNERYCGDMLLQKKYTPDEFPYRLIRNKGDIEQYYVYDAFPKIIDREILQKSIDKLDEAKQKYNQNQVSSNIVYPFTSIIKCMNCGSTFKRKLVRGKAYWSCSGHLKNIKECDIKAISEFDLMEAFLSVYHRLKNNRFMLEDYMNNIKKISMNWKVKEELLDIEDQIQAITRDKEKVFHYYTTALIDFKTFNEKMTDLQINKSLLELEKTKRNNLILRNMEVVETASILSTLEYSDMQEFDEVIFARIIDAIEINDEVIEFHMRNDLKVQIERKVVNLNVN